jgi:uncharacterized protein
MNIKTRISEGYAVKKIIVTIAVLFAAIPHVFVASFDCEKTKTTMERTVCSDARLSKMDEELAKLYAENKAELRSHPNDLKKLIKDQREWITDTKTSPCAAQVKCLSEDFEVRIKELRHKLNLTRASASAATGPSKEAVMKRLSEQLARLKELARKAKKVEISETLKANKPAVCEYIWKNLQGARVPEPTVYASTGQQKRELYMRLREMAYHNQRLFSAKGNAVKDPKNYKCRFNDLWKKYSRDFSEYDDTRRDTANLLFMGPDAGVGYKQPVFVTILLDLDENNLTLNREELRPDGLLYDKTSGLFEGAHSNEYWDDNLIDEPQAYEPAADYVGLMTIGKEVMFWKIRKGDNWELGIRPVHNPQDGREMSCTFEFDGPLSK